MRDPRDPGDLLAFGELQTRKHKWRGHACCEDRQRVYCERYSTPGSGKTGGVDFDDSELQRRLRTQFGLVNVGAPLTYQMHAHTHALFGAAVPSVLPTPRKEARR